MEDQEKVEDHEKVDDREEDLVELQWQSLNEEFTKLEVGLFFRVLSNTIKCF